MFTGLVEGTARLVEKKPQGPGVELTFELGRLSERLAIGDSVAINGCCLTVISREGDRLSFQAGEETLAKTGLGGMKPGSVANIERSLRVGDSMGGHFVTGHIDGQGILHKRVDDGDWSFFSFSAPLPLLRQMAAKGSIAVDGVSLTLVAVTDEEFSIALIPHTLSSTTLGQLRVGDSVNLETDILAKYVERISHFSSKA